MNTILYGNGFNRLNDVDSWEKLVHVIDDSHDNCKVPNTLQYEGKVLSVPFETNAILRTKDGKILKTFDHKILTAREQSETIIKKKIVNQMNTYKSNDLFDKLLCLNVEHYITTNYDYVADDALQSMNYTEDLWERDKSENTFSIHRKKCYLNNLEKKYLWKIHGELSNIKSIMLGYYHYCSYIGQIRKYITGEYEFAKRKDKGTIPAVENRLPITSNDIFSWIDLFFISNIYIIGLGLNYDEIDLWWILTIRKRLIQKFGRDFISNNIVYYGDLESGQKAMFEYLDVEVVTSKRKKYENKYQEYIDDINKRIRVIPADKI